MRYFHNLKSVSTEDPLLSGEWLETIQAFCKDSKVKLQDLLEECTQAFANLPDEEEEEDELEDLHESDEDMENDEMEDEPDSNANEDYDPFDSALMSMEELAKIEENKKIQYQHQEKQIEKVKKTQEISSIIQTMQSSEIKGYQGEAEKKLKCVFYLDGFTIDDGPLLSMNDPKNQRIIESFKNGVVPYEYSQEHMEVDVHVIWENCTYEEKKSQLEKEEENEMEDLYFQQQLAEIAEMERLERLQREAMAQENQEKPTQVEQSAKIGREKPMGEVQERTIEKITERTVSHDTKPKSEAQGVVLGSALESEDHTIYARKEGPCPYVASKDRPVTSIQFRSDRDRIVGEFNLDSPVSSLFEFIAHQSTTPSRFRLAQSFPRKNIEPSDRTIEEAGLKNAALLVQRVD